MTTKIYIQFIILVFVIRIFSLEAQNADFYSGPIIDMHLHAKAVIDRSTRFCFPQPCEGAPTLTKNAKDLKRLTIEAMIRNNIVLGILNDAPDNVLSWTEDEREIFMTGIDIGDPKDIDLPRIKELFTTGRAQVLGEIWSQYMGVPIDDPRLDPVFAIAHEFNLPVLVHVAGLGGSNDFPSHLGNPLRLVPILRKYPGIRIYLENAGWPFLEEVTAIMYQYPSVYADVSTILHLTPRSVALAYIKDLVDNGLEKRIMFGSDQMIWPEVIDVAVETLQSADFLNREQKADIFYNNAARFLRLSDEQITRHHKQIKPHTEDKKN